MALIKDKIKSAENKELLKNPLVRGMLNTIRYAEGTAGEDGYNTRVGGGKFSDLSKKPGKKVYIKSIGDYSSAEGAFQILNSTWSSVSKDLGLTDFSPESQDIAAVELIKRRGALNDILNGNFEIAVNKLSPEWASLPKSDGKGTYKNQKAKSIQQLSNIFYKNVDYNSAVKPYINTPEEQTYVIDTPEISNLVTPIEIPNLAESNETEAVQKAKEELDYKQQQQINQQRFIQDLLAASQVQYVDPNQVQQEDIYSQEQYFQKGGLYEDVYYVQNGGSIGNLTPQQTADVESQRQWLNEWNKNRVINGIKINTNSDIPFSSDIYIDDLNYNRDNTEKTLGEFDTISDRLILDTTYQSKTGIPVHEFSHRYQKYLDPSIYNKYINEPISTALKNTQGSSEYHGNVDENQAELNRLRYNAGFKPDQVITPQDLQNYNTEDYNLKHFSQEQLINLLNKTAYNQDINNQYYGESGGIVKDDNGYWNPNNWGKVVEINSNSITMDGVSEPLIGIGDNGTTKLMLPGQNYIFEGAKTVTEYPIKRNKTKRFS